MEPLRYRPFSSGSTSSPDLASTCDFIFANQGSGSSVPLARASACRGARQVSRRSRHLVYSSPFPYKRRARPETVRVGAVILFEAVDKHLERRDHSGTIGCDDFTLGRQFPLRPPCDLSTLGGAVRLIEQQPLTLSSVNPSGCPWIRGHLGKYASCRVPRSLPRLNRLGPPRFAWGP